MDAATSEIAVLQPPKNSTTGRLRPVRVPGWYRGAFQVAGAVAPDAAARWAKSLFFHPQKARLRPEEQSALFAAERFAIEVRGEQVAGWAWGVGPTVLLVHGWGGTAGQMTKFVGPLVDAGFR